MYSDALKNNVWHCPAKKMSHFDSILTLAFAPFSDTSLNGFSHLLKQFLP